MFLHDQAADIAHRLIELATHPAATKAGDARNVVIHGRGAQLQTEVFSVGVNSAENTCETPV